MDAASAGVNEIEPIVSDGWDADSHPWRRYGARIIDVQLFGGIAIIIIGLLIGAFGSQPMFDWVTAEARWKRLLVYTPLTWTLTAPAVAALLAWKGTTPGKLLFGVRVKPAAGDALSFGRALKREGIMLIWGIGLAIPVLNLIAAVSSYSRVEAGDRTRWDESVDLIVEARQISGWQLAGVVLGTILVALLLAWTLIERVIGSVAI